MSRCSEEPKVSVLSRSKAPQAHRAPSTHITDAPNQVWSWDISYPPSRVRGRFFYLYLITDIYSRRIVGREMHEQEDGEEAAILIQHHAITECCFRWPSEGFESLEAARKWVGRFLDWHNRQHRHGQIRFVTPASGIAGVRALFRRKQVYEQAKAANPARLSGQTHNWHSVGSVALKLERNNEGKSRAARSKRQHPILTNTVHGHH